MVPNGILRIGSWVLAGLLIAAGADVKAASRYGVTPLSLACTNGNASLVDQLLKAGADPNASQPGGETPLMTASRTGSLAIVTALLARGVVVDAKDDRRGQTALMWAAAEGHAAVIEALVAHGADVHARSNGGFTALLFAAREGQIAASKALVAAGANLNDAIPSTTPIDEPAPEETTPGPPEAGLNVFLLAIANAHFTRNCDGILRHWGALPSQWCFRRLQRSGLNHPGVRRDRITLFY